MKIDRVQQGIIAVSQLNRTQPEAHSLMTWRISDRLVHHNSQVIQVV